MNDLDKITLPDNLDEITLDTIKRAEGEKIRKKKFRKSILAASIAGIVLIGAALSTEGAKAAIEEIKGKIEGFYAGHTSEENQEDIVKQGLRNHKVIVNQTIEDSGVVVTLNEFYMDDEELYIYITAKDKNRNGILQGVEKTILLNKKPIESGDSSGIGFDFINGTNETGSLINNSIKRRDISDVKNVSINIDSLYFTDVEAKKKYNVKGKWEFSFDYDGSKAMKNIKYIDLDNKGINLGRDYVVLKKMKITPISVRIYTAQETCIESMYNLNLEDSKGNIVGSNRGHGTGKSLIYDFILDTNSVDLSRIIPSEYKKGLFGYKDIFYKEEGISIPRK
ncbi:MAG: DUF4179 domain-containing protein [Clostridium sp.]